MLELQQAAAKDTKVTVESLLRELEHARQRADDLDQPSASVKAITSKAAISGILTTKVEVTERITDDMSDAEIIGQVLAEHGHERACNARDREQAG